MAFELRPWLAQHVGVPPAELDLVSNRLYPEGEREIRYRVNARGVVTVRTSRTYFDDVWRIEAEWPEGEAVTDVALDVEVEV